VYSIYEDLPRCTGCGASVEPWIELHEETGLCSHCQEDEHAHAGELVQD
jgi:hypothetical protein